MRLLKFFLIAILALATPNLAAETRYIGDQLKVPMRDQPGKRSKIIKMIDSGAAVEFVVADKESGYSLVKFAGKEGWVLSRNLSKQPSARQRLKAAEKKLQKLNAVNAELDSRLEELSSGNENQSGQISGLQGENKQLQESLESLRRDTSDVVGITRTNKSLQSRVSELAGQNDSLAEENARLKDKTSKDWFLLGAGVIVAGILLGLILPRLRIKKRSNKWDDSF